MSGEILTSTVALNLKETLSDIMTDNTDGVVARAVYKQWMDDRPMMDAFEDDLEVAGAGLAAQVPEGSEIPVGTIKEGYVKRYTAIKFALRLIASEEALEDSKYPAVIQCAKRNKRALYKTLDIHSTANLVNITSASFSCGDGVAISSASHPLAHGGSFSNQLATPMAPSTASWNNVRAQLDQMVDHDGVVEGYEAKKVVFPSQQQGIWEELLGSEYDPRAGNFSAINIVKKDKPELIKNRYWNNTTTQWVVLTDAEGGFQQRWRKKPKDRSWVNEEHELMSYSISARWDNGISNPRAAFHVNA